METPDPLDPLAAEVRHCQTMQTSIVISQQQQEPKSNREAAAELQTITTNPPRGQHNLPTPKQKCSDSSTPTPQLPRHRITTLMAGNRVPINYQTPKFPSLYDPVPSHHKEAYYLYYTTDIWRFTLYWTLIFYGATHLTVAGCAVLTHCRNWSVIWLVPLLYSVVAGLEGLLAGSIVGLV